MIDKIKAENWKKGKPAGEFPKDFIVIPVLEVNEIIEKHLEELEKELKEKISDKGRLPYFDKCYMDGEIEKALHGGKDE